MTSLERYQLRMKEKKQRKKEKMELKAAARERGDEENTDGQDEFFGSDSSEEEEEQQPKPKSKPRSLEPTLADEDDLAAVAGTNEPDSNFSMKDIIKAEKEAGKKRRRRKSKKESKKEMSNLVPMTGRLMLKMIDSRLCMKSQSLLLTLVTLSKLRREQLGKDETNLEKASSRQRLCRTSLRSGPVAVTIKSKLSLKDASLQPVLRMLSRKSRIWILWWLA